MAEGPHQQAMGYILGKAEGEGVKWHGHVTAVTVSVKDKLTLSLGVAVGSSIVRVF